MGYVVVAGHYGFICTDSSFPLKQVFKDTLLCVLPLLSQKTVKVKCSSWLPPIAAFHKYLIIILTNEDELNN